MLCKHEVIGPMLRICPVCKHEARTDRPVIHECPGVPVTIIKPNRPAVAPRDLSVPCVHRGDLIREQECKPCQAAGLNIVPVYQCSQYGECTVNNTAIWPRIKACAGCAKYAAVAK